MRKIREKCVFTIYHVTFIDYWLHPSLSKKCNKKEAEWQERKELVGDRLRHSHATVIRHLVVEFSGCGHHYPLQIKYNLQHQSFVSIYFYSTITYIYMRLQEIWFTFIYRIGSIIISGNLLQLSMEWWSFLSDYFVI